MTPHVQYGYSEMTGGVNHSRQTGMTYPDGRVLTYNYGSDLSNSVSRVKWWSGSSGQLRGSLSRILHGSSFKHMLKSVGMSDKSG